MKIAYCGNGIVHGVMDDDHPDGSFKCLCNKSTPIVCKEKTVDEERIKLVQVAPLVKEFPTSTRMSDGTVVTNATGYCDYLKKYIPVT